MYFQYSKCSNSNKTILNYNILYYNNFKYEYWLVDDI